jgi:hypothetical protein
MSLSKFAVSKRRSNRMAADEIEVAAPETGRTRILSNSILNLSSEAEVVEEVSKLWGEAQEKFLAIGRYLRRAKDRFPGSFERKIVASLPFGKNVAYQLRLVAEAVDKGRLPEEHLPRSYATAFQLVSLPDPDFEEAKKRALVRSTVTRPEVNAFRKELQQIRSRSGDEVELLKRERSDLLREDEKLRARQAEVKARLHEIEQKLGIQ